MLTDWYRTIRLPITLNEFHQLPRNPVFKYEYFDGYALLSPRPKIYNALLDLQPMPVAASPTIHGCEIVFRPLVDGDWPGLARVFAAAFQRVQPFASLNDPDALAAAQGCIEQTRTGGDGPAIEPACIAATDGGAIVGAILITLIPRRPEGEWWDGKWFTTPPTPDTAPQLGRPHLTWVFVDPMRAGAGLGSALLARAVHSLHELGFVDLATTFLLGNDGSALWHWRNGFRLLPYPKAVRETW